MAVDAHVADASVIGIERCGGVQIFASHFDRHFDKIQRAVIPAAPLKKNLLFQVIVGTDIINS